MIPHDASALRNLLVTRLSEQELRDICFDLGADYEDLPGPTKSDKARELLQFARRRQILTDLIARLALLRPDVPWPDSDSHPDPEIASEDTPSDPQSSGAATNEPASRTGRWEKHPVAATLIVLVALMGTIFAIVRLVPNSRSGSISNSLTPSSDNGIEPTVPGPTHYTTTTAPIASATQKSSTPVSSGAQRSSAIDGAVTWNDEPVKGVVITLMQGGCFQPIVAVANTDESGSYRFGNLAPGEYTIGVNGFGAGGDFPLERNPTFETSCYSWPFTLRSGETLAQNRQMVKKDLVILGPTGDISDLSPTIAWKPYDNASYYLLSLFRQEPSFSQIVDNRRSVDTKLTLSETLDQGAAYSGWVIAYNANGTPITQGEIRFSLSRNANGNKTRALI